MVAVFLATRPALPVTNPSSQVVLYQEVSTNGRVEPSGRPRSTTDAPAGGRTAADFANLCDLAQHLNTGNISRDTLVALLISEAKRRAIDEANHRCGDAQSFSDPHLAKTESGFKEHRQKLRARREC